MRPELMAALRGHLTALAGLPADGVVAEPIRVWRLSGVERLHLPDGTSVVAKYAYPPFTDEDQVLAHLGEQDLAVPVLRASAMLDVGLLGMILDDLGTPIRDADEQDAAVAAVHLHAAVPAPWLPVLGPGELADLPAQAADRLQRLRADGRFADAADLLPLLGGLERLAASRARGTDRPPWGLCHGELHPSAVHITGRGRHVLDFAMTLTGPGLFDLAAWWGLRHPADPPRTRGLIERYVHVGGHPATLADRGGLPAEYWALGWHRVHAAHWLLGCATDGVDAPDTDDRHTVVLRRQLTGALQLLGH